MKKILRKQKSAYALSLIFCLIGIVAFLGALWKTYPYLSSSENPFSTFLSLLWTEKITLISGLEFKLIYLVIFGDVMLVSGVILWILSRQWFLIPGKTVWYQCPFCKKKWRSTGDKALVHCPHCRQLVHPKMTEK
jgi:DNA-directed RNA polymerase subunit RPC12/RpoP